MLERVDPESSKKRRDTRCTQREEGHVTTQAEAGVMYLQAKEHQAWPGATRTWKRQGKSLDSGLADTLILGFWLLELRE